MLVLPVRSLQRTHGSHSQKDQHTGPHPDQQQSDSHSTLDLQSQATDAMLSVMPTTSPSAPKRPKLSLQTSSISSSPVGQKSRTAPRMTSVAQSPTADNTCANCPFPTPLMPQSANASTDIRFHHHVSPSSSSSSATTSSSGHTSPFPSGAAYSLPVGAHSILRNSSIPRRIISSTTTRTAKVLFPAVKRVSFHERLEEIIPTRIPDETHDTSDLSESDTSDKRLEDEIAERRALDDLLEEETSTTPVQGRRKRRRDLIWRPLAEDSLASEIKSTHAPQGKAAIGRLPRHVPELKRETTARENTEATRPFVLESGWVSMDRTPTFPAPPDLDGKQPDPVSA